VRFRQPEVKELRASSRQHHVPGFHVPVHQAMTMRVIERIGQLCRVADDVRDWKWTARKPFGQCLPLDVLHHEEQEWLAVSRTAAFADVMQRADVWVIEGSHGARLTFEPCTSIGVRDERVGEDFDCDGAVEARVPSSIHLAHAPGTNQSENLIRTEAHAGRERHAGRWPAGLYVTQSGARQCRRNGRRKKRFRLRAPAPSVTSNASARERVLPSS